MKADDPLIDEPSELPVLPECWPAVNLFLACCTQWRTAGMSGTVIGLDYVAVEAVARANRLKLTRRLLADLQVMETTVVGQLAKRRKRR
jgi:Phage related hypothetical protein (DUF1799)